MFNPFLSGMKSISFCTKKPVHITFVSVEGACTGCSELYHNLQLSQKCPNFPPGFSESPVYTMVSDKKEYPAVANKQHPYHVFRAPWKSLSSLVLSGFLRPPDVSPESGKTGNNCNNLAYLWQQSWYEALIVLPYFILKGHFIINRLKYTPENGHRDLEMPFSLDIDN